MIDIPQVATWQIEWVASWHQHPFTNPYQEDWRSLVCEQHHWNFLLWHEEDIARNPLASDIEIAGVKRRIDRYNQCRNDWIEKLDDYVTSWLLRQAMKAKPAARLNTETIGSAIDRLSILALRLYHLDEQLARPDIDVAQRERVRDKLAVCQRQHQWLLQAATQLAEDIARGDVIHRTFRQNKMYNDASLNPQIYDAQRMATKAA